MIPKLKYDNIVKRMRNFMYEALLEAQKAADENEVPVGAVIVRDGEIIARAHNRTESMKDPTAHAEILAVREASRVLGGWRLTGCSMYVTAEPCSMCAGALVWARLDKLYIGTMDPKAGACGSVFNIPQDIRLNHYVDIETGIMADECSKMMKAFFKKLRNRKSNKKQI